MTQQQIFEQMGEQLKKAKEQGLQELAQVIETVLDSKKEILEQKTPSPKLSPPPFHL